MNRIITFFFLFICLSISSQIKIDSAKRKKFYDVISKENVHAAYSGKAGDKMLQYAQNDYEHALAYTIKFEDQYNKGDYIESLRLARIAKKYVSKTDSLQAKLRIQNGLIMSYRRAGLIVESDDAWTDFKKLVKSFPEDVRNINLLYTQSKIYDIDLDYCKAAETKEKFIDLNSVNVSDKDRFNSVIFPSLTQLAYSELKCGSIDKAKKTITRTEIVLSKIKKNTPIILKEFLYMDKALIAKIDNNKELSKKYFDSAYNFALSSPNIAVKKLILNERIEANIDTPEDLLTYSKLVNQITNQQSTTTKKLTSEETQKTKLEIQQKERNLKISISILIVIVIASCFLFYYYNQRNKKLRLKYEDIISHLSTPAVENKNVFFESKEIAEKEVIKNPETEQELIKNLQVFEKKKLYNTKGISMSQMAVSLKTNTKYLSYILKKYRNTDFYNYINENRINYITKELHDNPLLLQYKIVSISEMCGYSSHSQFTSIFKNIKGISPSQYINFLIQEKK